MKAAYGEEQSIIAEKFLKLPVVQKYEVRDKSLNGFTAEVELDDGYEFTLSVCIIEEAYPSIINQKIRGFLGTDKKEIPVIQAPYISEISAKICESNGVGFFDYTGNCLFYHHSIYLSEKGNKNRQPRKRGLSSIFERSSAVSSLILREIFQDIERTWRLKHLAEQVGCSIGQVSKVKEFLCKNMWAEMTEEGLKILQPEEVMAEWSRVYGKKEVFCYGCYSLENPAVFEKKLIQMKEQNGINYYLTGFSGGVRYAPVVKYNRVHVYIAPEDIREAMEVLECKEVESGQNVIIFPIEEECCVKKPKNMAGYSVVSPIQIYLDCMQLKGRGEEMAEAVMRKEILK